MQIKKNKRKSIRLNKTDFDKKIHESIIFSLKSKTSHESDLNITWLDLSEWWLKIKHLKNNNLLINEIYYLSVNIDCSIFNENHLSKTMTFDLPVKIVNRNSWWYWLMIIWDTHFEWKTIIWLLINH